MEQPSILERLRAFNRWTKGWAASIAVAVGIWIVLRSYLIEAFRIPSASMENTLLVGDFLFVNKAIYGGELEIPLTGIRCCRLPGYAEPQRDGIVVFRSVEDSTPNLNIVKRVIGGPTDTLQMTHDTVYRNGKRLDEPYALHLGSQPDDPLQLRKIRTLHLPYYVGRDTRSEEHTSELQSQSNLVCRLLLEKKKNNIISTTIDGILITIMATLQLVNIMNRREDDQHR